MKRNSLLLFVLVWLPLWALTQTTNSPYSFYGLGDINSRSFSHQRSMGQAQTAWASGELINTVNPGTFGSLLHPTFAVDLNIDFQTIETGSQSTSTNTVHFNNLAFAVPLGRRGGLAFSLREYTRIGYDIVVNTTDDILGDFSFVYDGQGGVNELLIGGGFNVLENDKMTIGVGASFVYNFGKAARNRRTTNFIDSPESMSSNQQSQSSIRDFGFDLGLYVDRKFSDDFKLSFGASYTPSLNANATSNVRAYTYRPFAGDEIIKDTTVFTELNGDVKMPSRLNLGLGFHLGKSWMIFTDYKIQRWSELTFFGQDQNLNDRTDFSVGLQSLPNLDQRTKYLQAIRYRLGLRLTETRLKVRDQNVSEYGVSGGLGLPMLGRKSSTTLNLGIEFGQRGSVEDGLIRESFTHLFIGISFNPSEKWFNPRKYE